LGGTGTGHSHHGSHRALLRSNELDPPGTADIDAIIVPTRHTTDHLRSALRIAHDLGCPLLALCSQAASAEAARSVADTIGADLVAIDFAGIPGDVLPRFATTELLAGTPFEYHRDTSAKRNLGLLLADLMGWQRIVFLDDDITVPNPEDLRRATHLLDRYAAAGLAIKTYPDHSVVCHAYRATGAALETFIGGGALAVGTAARRSFFPSIYNEDWFFLLNGRQLRPATLTGAATQDDYDPYQGTERAESEEFGDCLGEGVFAALHDSGTIEAATDHDYWHDFLQTRLTFVRHVIDRVGQSAMPAAERMIDALRAAYRRSGLITPSTCVDYLSAWRADRRVWRQHVDMLLADHQPGLSRLGQLARLEKVLSELGLMECSCLTMT